MHNALILYELDYVQILTSLANILWDYFVSMGSLLPAMIMRRQEKILSNPVAIVEIMKIAHVMAAGVMVILWIAICVG